jgi:hypothetical protein
VQLEDLWAAGQKRLDREQRARLSELYVGVRDGYVAGNIATGKAKPKGSFRAPSYTRDTDDSPQTVQQYRSTLARLGQMVPGLVTTRKH